MDVYVFFSDFRRKDLSNHLVPSLEDADSRIQVIHRRFDGDEVEFGI